MKETIINWQPEDLEDDIIKIVPLKNSYFENLYEAASDPLIWEQHPSSDRYKKEVFKNYFDEGIASDTAFVIRDKASDNIIGSTRYYDYNHEQSSIAIGFTFLSRQYWGGKYNRSCKQLLLDYAFRFVDKVYFHIGASNIRSQMAITKLGAKKVGEDYRDHAGKKQLHYEYCINKDEWRK